MSMSKKDYQALARAIYQTRAEVESSRIVLDVANRPAAAVQMLQQAARAAVVTLADRIADVLAADNPRFDRARFLEACETGTTKGMKKVS